ncbi:class I SAM-dependent methyltransferase [Haloferax sp. S1W]|uniref:class I SAM-dependent methyltransferase n=1 Tax=Haloferax sp. S1W TaxID=3377110 RepID=UPI0037C66375
MDEYTRNTANYWDTAISTGGRAQSVGIRVLPESVNYHRKAALFQVIDRVLANQSIKVDGCEVLDAGCGTGIYSEFYIENGASVTGVDLSDEAIRDVGERLPGEYYQSSLDELPFENDSFDLVHSFSVLYHIIVDDEWEQSLKELVRVCKPGGLLVLRIEWRDETVRRSKHVKHRARERYIEVMDEAGCSLVETNTFDDVVPFRSIFSLLNRLSLDSSAELFGEIVGKAGLFAENPNQRVVVFRVPNR